MKAILLVAASFLAQAHEGGPSFFDGAAGARRPPLAAAVPQAAGRPVPAPAVPADLAAAKARVGNEAMIARLPARQAPEPFAFGVIGDTERGRFWWERVFSPGSEAFPAQWRALQDRAPDFVFQLGDFVSEGDEPHYREHVSVIEADLRRPLMRCVGNHDRSHPNGPADKKFYDAVFGPRDYFFDHGGWRFVSLDSSDRVVTASQLDWLRKALAVPGPKAIFTHVPPVYLRKVRPLAEVGPLEQGPAKVLMSEKRGYLDDFFTNYFEDGASQFEALVSDSGVKAVYMGHIHAFWAADHRGVRYVISGGGGSPLYPLPPGYPKKRFAHTLWVEAGADRLTETVHPLTGTPFVLPPVVP